MIGASRSRAETPDVVAPPPKHPRFPLSDGLRALPAVAILIGHSWLFTGGFGGFTDSLPNRAIVRIDGLFSLFFLLSAFLLYRPMIAHRAGGPKAPRVSDYGVRRFLRIYPAYWVALTAFAIFPGLFGVFTGKWWAFYSLTTYFDYSNLSDVCPGLINNVDQFVRCGLPQSWSIGLEVSFYLALPLYAAVTALLARGRDVRTWMKLELALLGFLAALSLFLGGPPFSLRHEDWFEFTFAAYFSWFALGLAVAVLSVVYSRSELPRPLRFAAARPSLCFAAAFSLYLVTVLFYYPAPFPLAPLNNFQYISLNLIQGASTVLLLVPAVFGNPNRGAPAKVLTHPVLMWLGVISYGIALWHVTIIANLGFAGADAGFWTVLILGTLLTLPLAAISYYLVERPLMRFKYRSIPDALRSAWRRSRRPVPDAGGSE